MSSDMEVAIDKKALAQKYRLFYKICRNCGAKNPPTAEKCRWCHSKNLRWKRRVRGLKK